MYSRHSLLTCGASVVAFAVAVPAHAQERLFDIPAQPAVRAIPELARQAQVPIVAMQHQIRNVDVQFIVDVDHYETAVGALHRALVEDGAEPAEDRRAA